MVRDRRKSLPKPWISSFVSRITLNGLFFFQISRVLSIEYRVSNDTPIIARGGAGCVVTSDEVESPHPVPRGRIDHSRFSLFCYEATNDFHFRKSTVLLVYSMLQKIPKTRDRSWLKGGIKTVLAFETLLFFGSFIAWQRLRTSKGKSHSTHPANHL